MSKKPRVTGTRHHLPFGELSPLQFERLCLWLAEREGYLRPEHYGEAGGDEGRDVVAYKDGGLWYFQCKRYKEISAQTLLVEVDKIAGLARKDPTLRPVGIVFVTNASVTARARDTVSKH